MGPLILLLSILGAGGLWYQVHKNDPKNTRYQLTFPPESDGEPLRSAVFNLSQALGGFLESANGHGGYIVSIPPHIAQGQLATAVIALGAPGIAKIAGDSIDIPGFDYVQRNNDRALVPHVDVYLQPDGRFFDDTGPRASLQRMNEAGGATVSGGKVKIAGQIWDGSTLTGPTTHHRQGIADGGRTLSDNGTRRRRTW